MCVIVFGMLTTTEDPPFPIYVLFLLFNLCQSATKKVRQGGGGGGGPPLARTWAFQARREGHSEDPPTPTHTAQAISLLPLFHLH